MSYKNSRVNKKAKLNSYRNKLIKLSLMHRKYWIMMLFKSKKLNKNNKNLKINIKTIFWKNPKR